MTIFLIKKSLYNVFNLEVLLKELLIKYLSTKVKQMIFM